MIYAFSRENGYKWIIDEYYSMYYRQHDENELGVKILVSRAFFHRLKQVFSGEAIRKHLQLKRLLKFKNYNLPASDFIENFISFVSLIHQCTEENILTKYYFKYFG